MFEMYNNYSLGPVCQDCICICISGGVTTISGYGDSNYAICVSCVVTCRSPTDGSCTCVCADECSAYNYLQSGPFLASCPTRRSLNDFGSQIKNLLKI